MGARDRWTIAIRCPACGKTGDVEVSQEDGWSYMRNQSTTIDRMPEGFSVKRTDDSAASMTFLCNKDGAIAEKG